MDLAARDRPPAGGTAARGGDRAWRDAGLVGVVALGVRVAVVVWAHARFPAVEDGHYYDVLARRLASGAGYTWLWPDGAVTYAAHYPVGYPALLATAYRVFGASGAVGMMVAAVLGALSAVAAHRLVDGAGVARWRPVAAGLAVAVHPALAPYTAAFMTEGVTASLLIIAAGLAAGARGSPIAPVASRARAAWIGAGVVLGIATLVRPQSLLAAPVLGALSVAADRGWRARAWRAAAVTGIALACVAPWTARNCARMHRCALVSVNGGWNLLIGAQTRSGGWEPIEVPPECATVWDEAGKDGCFARAGWARIAAAPGAWLARSPGKIASTLDYFGAAPWYLHASNAAAFDDAAKLRLAVVETAFCRLALLAALVVAARAVGPRSLARRLVALAGAVAAVTLHAWLGYMALAAIVALAGPRSWARGPLLAPCTAAIVVLTAALHAVFFGAGRYGLVVVPFVAAAALLPSAPRNERPSRKEGLS